MKATAIAHPIQGLVKYHGLRDGDTRIPFHDSISVCCAPASTNTTVEFGYSDDSFVLNGEDIDEHGASRVTRVLDRVREDAGVESGARVESRNDFPSNVGLGASSSAFAALAYAACHAAEMDVSRSEVSMYARWGSSSAARSVTGGFSHLYTSDSDGDCVSRRIDDGFGDEIRVVIGLIPVEKRTDWAHSEATESSLFQSRLSYIHGAIAEMRSAVIEGDFEGVFGLAESDSLSLLAVTMTGPRNWVYWAPETLELYDEVRDMRGSGVPVYLSTDTGATAYLNTTESHVDEVVDLVEGLGLNSMVWKVGGGAQITDEHLF